MIVLTQQLNTITEEWTDIKVPRKIGPPSRNRYQVETPQEFADALINAGLVGVYRSVEHNGIVSKITVSREDRFVATIEQEIPDA